MERGTGTRQTPTDKDIPQREKTPPEKSLGKGYRDEQSRAKRGSDSETLGEIERDK